MKLNTIFYSCIFITSLSCSVDNNSNDEIEPYIRELNKIDISISELSSIDYGEIRLRKIAVINIPSSKKDSFEIAQNIEIDYGKCKCHVNNSNLYVNARAREIGSSLEINISPSVLYYRVQTDLPAYESFYNKDSFRIRLQEFDGQVFGVLNLWHYAPKEQYGSGAWVLMVFRCQKDFEYENLNQEPIPLKTEKISWE